MKKLAVCLGLICLILGIFFAFGEQKSERNADDFLRVHIRANSNSKEDQAVKYLVRDRVVEFLTPTVAECESKSEAISAIEKKLPQAVKEAEKVLRSCGHGYGVRAEIRRETFPTRVYGNTTLDGGVYDSLIIELGTGAGDNWWCVVYPPLCFSSGNGNIVYQSKIAQIIRHFFQ